MLSEDLVSLKVSIIRKEIDQRGEMQSCIQLKDDHLRIKKKDVLKNHEHLQS